MAHTLSIVREKHRRDNEDQMGNLLGLPSHKHFFNAPDMNLSSFSPYSGSALLGHFSRSIGRKICGGALDMKMISQTNGTH